MTLFKQSFFLLLSFGFVFVWQKTPLSGYTIQIFGFFIFLFLLLSARKKGYSPTLSNASLSIFILNSIILLLIFSTGGFSSSLFFLLYFLSFGIAFIFEPATVFVFVICAFLIFLPDALKDDVLGNLVRIGSLVLVSPLAFFFGREYTKDEKQEEKLSELKERTKDAADTISYDVEEILEDNKDDLKQKDVKNLNDILEETEDLREETRTN